MMRKYLFFSLLIAGLAVIAAPLCISAQDQTLPAPDRAPFHQSLSGVPAQAQAQSLRLTVLYDNIVYDDRFRSDWGFAALIEYGGHTLLFDCGANGIILLENMKKLHIDLKSIEIIIFSHDHYDHTGGLGNLMATGIKPTIYMLSSFSEYLKEWARHQTHLIEIEQSVEIIPGIYVTGSVQPSDTSEQALLVKTSRGTVIVTGCAHPGIVRIVDKAQEILPGQIAFLAGGFHLLGMEEEYLQSIIKKLHQKDVEKVMPTHCSGDKAISMFKKEFGENFIKGGVGRVMVIE